MELPDRLGQAAMAPGDKSPIFRYLGHRCAMAQAPAFSALLDKPAVAPAQKGTGTIAGDSVFWANLDRDNGASPLLLTF